MRKDLLVVSTIATIVEDLNTFTMSVWLPTKEDKIIQKEGPTKEVKILQEEGAKEKNHHQERGGVEMMIVNEDPHGEVRIQKERTSHQGATQNEDIKLMFVNGFPASTPTKGQVIKELHKTKTSSSCL